MAQIVILGGGIGGVAAAVQLKRRIDGSHRVVLIDRNPVHVFRPSYPWLVVGKRKGQDISRRLAALERRGIEFLRDEVVALDLKKRAVRTRRDAVRYDYLIVALGDRLLPETVPGFETHAHDYFDLPGVERLREVLKNFRSGRIAIAVCGFPYKCPASPYELALLLDWYFSVRWLREKVEIDVITPESRPLSGAPVEVSEKLGVLTRSRNVNIIPGSNVARIDRGFIHLDHGGRVAADLIIGVPPHSGHPMLREAGLAGADGWVETDGERLTTSFERVFAVGDVVKIRLPSGNTYLSKTGVFAESQGKVVARNIASSLKGERMDARFTGDGSCVIDIGFGKGILFRVHEYTEPEPKWRLFPPSRAWIAFKLLSEIFWLRRHF